MRQMKLEIEGDVIYESSFDPKTGTIVRAVEEWERVETYPGMVFSTRTDNLSWESREVLNEQFPNRYNMIPSPSPELIDVSITNKCGFGCSYCYQDSTPGDQHAPKELVPEILKGLKVPPYQIAIGGGEPTLHPDFIWILEQARELGTVPNYTTAGHAMTKRIMDATNSLCGGVAMTYHSFKGLDWFREHYRKLREGLKCQVNIHLIADNDAPNNIRDLIKLQNEVGQINLVLLAYYPDVGRASLVNLMTRTTYSKLLPEAITTAQNSGMKVAFSEGLLPFFLSRPEIGVDTRFAARSEGLYSCYIGPDGQIAKSSFEDVYESDPEGTNVETVWNTPMQMLWEQLHVYSGTPSGEACGGCKFSGRCATPHNFHYLTCAYATHNRMPLTRPARKGQSRYELLTEDDDV